MRKILLVILVVVLKLPLLSQEPEKTIRAIFDEALTDRSAYNQLEYICKNTKGRIPGSPAAAEAVEFTRQALIKSGADSVWLQKVPVPHWERGFEMCRVVSATFGSEDLTIAALGLSVGTSMEGLISKVIEVHDFEELKLLGKKTIEGKTVFFNRAVDNKLINSFAGYGSAVNQRTQGASEASKYGAVAVIVRSATQALDDFPHTGVCRYEQNVEKIPAVAISTVDAELLSRWLKTDSELTIHLTSTCRNYPDTWSFNVIGEIRGSQKPGEYISAGGHLDAWDISEGAHDDAGGCVQAIEMIRIFKKLGIRPKRTIRAVMFMNEEMTGTGGRIYADEAKRKGEIHYAALESDRGVMSPRGFGFDAEGERLEKLVALSSFFVPYNIRDFDRGGGGSDISPLKPQGTLLIGSIPDTQRYFYYHHSANDTFEQVNFREFQMGSAASASLIYLIDLLDL
ncbi:MAG: peptidase M28 family protein [Odoribacter sp.]|nr:peptidase M28 family protein [Odoribacter sp.]